MNNKFLSIIIPTYNRSDFFEETLKSIINQNSEKWECIVVDDGSDKEHLLKIKNACKTSNKIKLFERPNSRKKGACSCRNFGAEKANSDYIVFLDSDDCLGKSFVEIRLNKITANPKFDMLIFPVIVFYEIPGDSNILWNEFNDDNDLLRFLNLDIVWHTTSPVWFKPFFNLIKGFDERLITWQDWELHIRSIINGAHYKKYSIEPDIYYRQHQKESISKSNKSPKYYENQLYLLQKVFDSLVEVDLIKKEYLKKIAKLAFTFYRSSLNSSFTSEKFLKFINYNKLISKNTLTTWKWRSKHNNLFTKIYDKLVYAFEKNHFLDTKTSFLKTQTKK